MPRITYSTAAEHEPARPRRREPTSHLTAVAVVIGALFLIVSSILWYRLATQKKTPTATEVATKVLGGTKPYDAQDGLRLCSSRIPTVGTKDEQDKRQECYHAVMILFGDSSFCDSPSLDAGSGVICRSAARFYNTTIAAQSGSGAAPGAAGTGQTPAPGGSTPGSNGTAPGSGNTQGTGAGGVGIPSRGAGSTGNGNSSTATAGTNANGNTNVAGGDQASGNTNGTTGTASGTTNTNSNTNGTAGTASQSSNGNTNSSTNANVNSNTNTNNSLCTNEAGEIILLQHSNQCQ